MSSSEPAADRSRKFRFERKFFIGELDRFEVEAIVRAHPALFVERFPQRWVNNIYLDSPGLQNYFDNTAGIADRLKVRIRWYGDLIGAILQPVLEFKIKRGLLGTKSSFALAPLEVRPGFDDVTLRGCIEASDLAPGVRDLVLAQQPALVNRYRRKYLESADGRVRLTLDWDREFLRIDSLRKTGLHVWADSETTIVELKYDPDFDWRAAEIANHFPFRLTKSSKYVQGLEATNYF